MLISQGDASLRPEGYKIAVGTLAAEDIFRVIRVHSPQMMRLQHYLSTHDLASHRLRSEAPAIHTI